jgi:DNA recombination protein RmuC
VVSWRYASLKQRYQYLMAQYEQLQQEHDQLQSRHEQEQRQHESERQQVEQNTQTLQREHSAQAATLSLLTQERNALSARLEALTKEHQATLREKDLANERLSSAAKQMEQWEKTKQEHLHAAKASVMEAGAILSNKLLADHTRERQSSQVVQEKNIKETTQKLHEQFERVFKDMHHLHERIGKSESVVDLVKNSLLNPGGAGALSEMTLENIFKASGMREGYDYSLQRWVSSSNSATQNGTQINQESASNNGKRPDALVYLPGDSVLIIDSKASKFFLEVGQATAANDAEKEAHFTRSLKQTMKQHLQDLIKRDYKKAVKEDPSLPSSHAMTVMFLPTELALEKLRQCDPSFEAAAWKQGIVPVGPSGLINLLVQARTWIAGAKQEENAKEIIQKVTEMIDSVGTLHGHAQGLGKSIKAASSKYDTFAGSFNRTFISKAKSLKKLGIEPHKYDHIPQLERYQVVENSGYIELEPDDQSSSMPSQKTKKAASSSPSSQGSLLEQEPHALPQMAQEDN